MKRKRLELDDLEAVRQRLHAVRRGRGLGGHRRAASSGAAPSRRTCGSPASPRTSRRIGTIRELEQGRHLVQQDIDQARRVAVVGMRPRRRVLRQRRAPWARRSTSTATSSRSWASPRPRARSSAQSQDNFVWLPITTFQKLYGSRRSITIQAEARLDGRVRGGPGPGAAGDAQPPPPHLPQGRRLHHRDRREHHGALADRHPGHLRGHHRGHRRSACSSAGSW